MEIKIDNKNMIALKELKENIEKLLEIEMDDMEVNEQNLKKAKEIADTIYKIGSSTFRVGGLKLKIEISDGTELTII